MKARYKPFDRVLKRKGHLRYYRNTLRLTIDEITYLLKEKREIQRR